MPKREVDKRKTARALRKLQRAAERAGVEGAPDLTAWEKDFVEGVTKRLETYGSAFRDPGKGRLEEALSQRQHHVARAIDKKSRVTKARDGQPKAQPKGRDAAKPASYGSSFKRKSPLRSRAAPARNPRVRDVNDDLLEDAEKPLTPAQKRAQLQVIEGSQPPRTPRKPPRTPV